MQPPLGQSPVTNTMVRAANDLPNFFRRCRGDRLTFENMLDDYVEHFDVDDDFDWIRGNSIAGAFGSRNEFYGFGSEQKTAKERAYLDLWRHLCERSDALADVPADDIENITLGPFLSIYHKAGSIARGDDKPDTLDHFVETMRWSVDRFISDGGDENNLVYKRLLREREELIWRTNEIKERVKLAEAEKDRTNLVGDEANPASSPAVPPPSSKRALSIPSSGNGGVESIAPFLVAGVVIALAIWLAIFLLGKATSRATPIVEEFREPTQYQVPSDGAALNVNLRSGPGQAYSAVSVGMAGSAVTGTARALDSEGKPWLKVRTAEGKVGFIKERLLKPEGL